MTAHKPAEGVGGGEDSWSWSWGEGRVRLVLQRNSLQDAPAPRSSAALGAAESEAVRLCAAGGSPASRAPSLRTEGGRRRGPISGAGRLSDGSPPPPLLSVLFLAASSPSASSCLRSRACSVPPSTCPSLGAAASLPGSPLPAPAFPVLLCRISPFIVLPPACPCLGHLPRLRLSVETPLPLLSVSPLGFLQPVLPHPHLLLLLPSCRRLPGALRGWRSGQGLGPQPCPEGAPADVCPSLLHNPKTAEESASAARPAPSS
ncbi:uncharacterized protein LOC123233101 [Gracilinanus agilis]|uniref:uncharacterized protein LOC123233101 n=1 Tax=Gracilinanus agilis TaxID=191870 RepID=UPI001CFEE80B|nr:uncharacterized protein LOC123233101 [Gracilinanus agilis]